MAKICKRDHIVFATIVLLSFSFLIGAATNYVDGQRSQVLAIQKHVLHVSVSKAIGAHPVYVGRSDSPYTLVEFGDYQCPPCRQANTEIPETLQLCQGRVRFTFRNLPLVQIHPYAMRAAIVAEAAREQGRFWLMHDALYQGGGESFDGDKIQHDIESQHMRGKRFDDLCATSAKATVADDMNAAKVMGIRGTPTFLLCCPDGKVVQLTSLNQLSSYVGSLDNTNASWSKLINIVHPNQRRVNEN